METWTPITELSIKWLNPVGGCGIIKWYNLLLKENKWFNVKSKMIAL